MDDIPGSTVLSLVLMNRLPLCLAKGVDIHLSTGVDNLNGTNCNRGS